MPSKTSKKGTSHHLVRLGLTGMIATGKSAVSKVLSESGVWCVDADRIWADLLEPGQPGHQAVVGAFGPSMLSKDGRVDKAALRLLAFSDERSRTQLEEVAHPLIRAEFYRLYEEMESHARAGDGTYWGFCLEATLLREGADRKLLDWFDYVIVVTSQPEVQNARLVAHRDLTPNEASQIIDIQSQRKKANSSKLVEIENNGSLEDLISRTQAFVSQIKKKRGVA